MSASAATGISVKSFIKSKQKPENHVKMKVEKQDDKNETKLIQIMKATPKMRCKIKKIEKSPLFLQLWISIYET